MNARLSDKLGMVEVSHRGDRFCFHILPEGVEYVHENTKENEFIRELVNLVAKHGCTIDQIYELFTAHSDRVGREKMDNGEFDERIWFQDDADDPYYYCFKQEGGHMIYHRFLPEENPVLSHWNRCLPSYLPIHPKKSLLKSHTVCPPSSEAAQC